MNYEEEAKQFSISLGKLVRQYRQKAKLTQKQLNKETHISLAVLADFENGKSIPRLPSIMKLFTRLNIPLNSIFLCSNNYKNDNPKGELLEVINNFDNLPIKEIKHKLLSILDMLT